MDSCLGVRRGSETVFNINDAKINARDCRIIRRVLGRIDVLLNQFSLAGYSGYVDFEAHLPRHAQQDLDNMMANHRDLGARVTIPFASFVYFSCTDNRYLNRFHNTPGDVARLFGREAVILYPGDGWTLGTPHDNEPALRRFDEERSRADQLPYDEVAAVPLDEVRQAFLTAAATLHRGYPQLLLRRLKPVTIRIPDLAVTVRLSVPAQTFEMVDGEPEPDLNRQLAAASLRVPLAVGRADAGRLGAVFHPRQLPQLAAAPHSLFAQQRRALSQAEPVLHAEEPSLHSRAASLGRPQPVARETAADELAGRRRRIASRTEKRTALPSICRLKSAIS